MSRPSLLVLAASAAAIAVGCAHCDTCDDFPAPCTGPNCGYPYQYGGPVDGGMPFDAMMGAPAMGPVIQSVPGNGPGVEMPRPSLGPDSSPSGAPAREGTATPPAADGQRGGGLDAAPGLPDLPGELELPPSRAGQPF